MSFTIDDAEDLLKLLREHPEWKARVRLEVLGEELLSLPELVRQNGEDIRDLQAIVRQNSADIRQNSEDIRGLQELARENGRLLQDLTQLSRMHEDRLTRFGGHLGDVQGAVTEYRWGSHFSGRFGTLARRLRLVTPRELERFEDADDAGTITEEEALAVRQADLLIEGVSGRGPEAKNVLLVVEVSTHVESHDVERAKARAATLARLGYPAVAVVAGARMDATLRDEANAQGVRVVLRPEDLTRWAALARELAAIPAASEP